MNLGRVFTYSVVVAVLPVIFQGVTHTGPADYSPVRSGLTWLAAIAAFLVLTVRQRPAALAHVTFVVVAAWLFRLGVWAVMDADVGIGGAPDFRSAAIALVDLVMQAVVGFVLGSAIHAVRHRRVEPGVADWDRR